MTQFVPQQALRIANVDGASDYWFDWFFRSGKLVYQRRPDGPRVDLATGITSQEAAMSIAAVFALGMIEASKVRLVPWPQQQEQGHGQGQGRS